MEYINRWILLQKTSTAVAVPVFSNTDLLQ